MPEQKGELSQQKKFKFRIFGQKDRGVLGFDQFKRLSWGHFFVTFPNKMKIINTSNKLLKLFHTVPKIEETSLCLDVLFSLVKTEAKVSDHSLKKQTRPTEKG